MRQDIALMDTRRVTGQSNDDATRAFGTRIARRIGARPDLDEPQHRRGLAPERGIARGTTQMAEAGCTVSFASSGAVF